MHVHDPGEEEVEKWLAGDDAAFEQVFRRYYRLVVAFFAGRGFSPDKAEDLAQEAFFRVYRSRDSFRRDARFATWLLQICTNVFRNDLRDRSAQKRDGIEVTLGSDYLLEAEGEEDNNPYQLVADQENPLDRALRKEVEATLRLALTGLAPQMRRAVELRVYQDLKYREIAERMKISMDTVRSYLFDARQILKQVLGGYFDDFTS